MRSVGLGGCCVSPVLIATMVTSRQRYSAVHATTPVLHGWGLARLTVSGSGPASGGGVGLIQGGLPIGFFVWVHGVSGGFGDREGALHFAIIALVLVFFNITHIVRRY